MLKKIPKESMYTSDLGWLKSRFHFSFAEYINHDNVNFGILRVLNDDIIHADSGFDMHPHQDMEIVSYIVDGEITHKDSMGNEEMLKRGEVQYLSAGAGIAHAEYNKNMSEDLRLLQIWIVPPEKNLQRLYGSFKYKYEDRKNRLLNIVSSHNGDAEIKLHQDVDFYVSELDKGRELEYEIAQGRQLYFVQIEGSVTVNNITLESGDAMEIVQEKCLWVQAKTKSHFLFIEMLQSS